MAYLTVRVKDVEGHSTQDLNEDRMVLGRSSANAITIRSESISREHCVFIRQDDVWYLEDNGSANGTKVNREKIEGRVALKERDIIHAGKARLTFHSGSPGGTGKKKSSMSDGAAIALSSNESEDGVPVISVSAHDPSDAMPCSHCGAWFSIAHRLPGDRMDCPRCGKMNTVATMTTAEG